MTIQKNNQHLTRKQFVGLLAAVPLGLTSPLQSSAKKIPNNSFPARDAFDIKGTYLNAAYTHPMSKGSVKEIGHFLNQRMGNRLEPQGFDGFDRGPVLEQFAKMINATPEEIAWVPSTMFGENFIVSGLSKPGSAMKVVTDAFHFHGSLHLYAELAKKGAIELAVVRPNNNQIDLNALDAAIKPGTKLVAISLVSATTGFQHNLKAVCAIAHAKGAMVYADIIQAAGTVPIDVRESNVDFCACSTYKWLMGDFGIGFLYVRKDRLQELHRTFIGFRQIQNFNSHFLPFDPAGSTVFDSSALENMSGHFEVGTFANEGICALRYSLKYLNDLGTANIQTYRQPLINRIQEAISGNKFLPLTPEDSSSPIVCFAFKDAAKLLKEKLSAADINIQLYDNMIRISPSFYNDMDDIEKLISVLKLFK